jgi:eukaryotic-like serine/threonine-protein kinase
MKRILVFLAACLFVTLGCQFLLGPGVSSDVNIIQQVAPKDGMVMVYVQAGKFTMGSNSYDDEKPIHKVTLHAYWIDQTEVTNALYVKCVDAGVCQPPSSPASSMRSGLYYGNPEFNDYPVIHVDWNKAKTYCKWAGRRLPTEAEWEKAARGTDERTYPWGNDSPTNDLLNFNGSVGDTTQVGTYPNGASPYGAYDMAGNVWEWVSSMYQPYPYSATDGREDLSANGSRVLRGGAWDHNDYLVRSVSRGGYKPSYDSGYVGFRCASNVTVPIAQK